MSGTSRRSAATRGGGERPEHFAYPDGRVVLWGFPDRHAHQSWDPNTCIPERRVEYLPLLAPWFVARHRGRIDALRRKAAT